ncbi:ABC-three component system middle component 6 [Microscilla marina]|uniref:Uncharacterized protein n=1 Tax=Microscilla marina ATCC 23134 TaxID=313606 RepID=A1ZY04_MICM2|nr:conserved hypothetical protein [Microscilla marina ATCC 23134]
MNRLISKDENIKSSSVYVGYLILKELKKFKKKGKDKISLFDLTQALKKEKITHYRQIVFALMFLYSCDIINFEEPYIYIV